MKKYAFYSPLPPEDFLKELYRQSKTETEKLDHWHGEDMEEGQWKAAWKLEWDGELMTLNCTRSARIEERGTQISASSHDLSFFSGRRFSWNTSWGELFRGKIEPDGEGGSVLLGRFHMLPGSILSAILLSAGVLVYLINGWGNATARMTGLAAAMAVAAWSIRQEQKVGENPLSQETLEFLKRHSDRWENILP